MLNLDVLRDQPELRGDRVTLKQLDETYAEDSWRRLDDPEVRRLTGTHTTFTLEYVANWLAGMPGRADRADWAITAAATGAFLGDVSLKDIDVPNRSASFRIALSSERVLGNGYGTEATKLVVDFAFDVVGLHRVSLDVFGFNPRAQRVYEKCGFVREGVQRDALRWDGEWHDAIVMAALATDPR
jgi:RimJ/RimL family protein N-acetyltransferase